MKKGQFWIVGFRSTNALDEQDRWVGGTDQRWSKPKKDRWIVGFHPINDGNKINFWIDQGYGSRGGHVEEDMLRGTC